MAKDKHSSSKKSKKVNDFDTDSSADTENSVHGAESDSMESSFISKSESESDSSSESEDSRDKRRHRSKSKSKSTSRRNSSKSSKRDKSHRKSKYESSDESESSDGEHDREVEEEEGFEDDYDDDRKGGSSKKDAKGKKKDNKKTKETAEEIAMKEINNINKNVLKVDSKKPVPPAKPETLDTMLEEYLITSVLPFLYANFNVILANKEGNFDAALVARMRQSKERGNRLGDILSEYASLVKGRLYAKHKSLKDIQGYIEDTLVGVIGVDAETGGRFYPCDDKKNALLVTGNLMALVEAVHIVDNFMTVILGIASSTVDHILALHEGIAQNSVVDMLKKEHYYAIEQTISSLKTCCALIDSELGVSLKFDKLKVDGVSLSVVKAE